MVEFDLINAPLKGTNLIEASAGTGKTYAISGLFIRLILEKKLLVNEILVVTFTQAATEELKDRIRGKLKQTLEIIKTGNGDDPVLKTLVEKCTDRVDAVRRVETALRNFDEAAISTIHGFCQRTLRENAFESGSLFDTELVDDLSGLKLEVVDDFWRNYFCNVSPIFANYIRNKNLNPDYFLKRIGRLHEKPTLNIIPQTAVPDTEQLEERYTTAFENVRHEWVSVSGIVEDIFLNFEGLNRAKYKKSNAAGWLVQIRNYLSSNSPDPLFEKFIKFTSSEINNSLKKNADPLNLPFFDLCEELQSVYDGLFGAFEQKRLGLEIKLFEYLQDELAIRKQKQNIQFYDDLLNKLYYALLKTGGAELCRAVRNKYKAALIDEFQDTDPVQYFIFDKIFGGPENILFLIGDPKQAIYSFRGADVYAYLKAIKQADVRQTLTSNWRSEPALIKAVNAIFEYTERPFVSSEIPFIRATAAQKDDRAYLIINGTSEPPFYLWFVDTDSLEERRLTRDGLIKKPDAQKIISRAIASETSRLLNLSANNKAVIGEKPLIAGDIAVLVRTNKEAHPVKEALSALNIPSVLYSDADLFESHEAAEMERLLTGIVRTDSESLLKAALATDIIGLNGEKIFELSENEKEWELWHDKFSYYHDLWNRFGFFRMIRFLITLENVRSRLLAFPDGERRLTNLLHLSETLNNISFKEKLDMTGLLKWLSDRNDNNIQRLEEHQLRLESDENAVKIVTIHKSKGLEYPIVFCPFTWGDSRLRKDGNNIFHDEQNDFQLTLDLGSDNYNNNKVSAEKELLAENLRLLYVAITRAKSRCYLAWGRFNKAATSAMAYMLVRPEHNDSSNLLTELEAGFNGITDKEFYSRLKTIQSNADRALLLEKLPRDSGMKYIPPLIDQNNLSCREFSGAIDHSWKVASFSYLISGLPYTAELPDRDLPGRSDELIKETHRSDIFAFPGGIKTGTLLHEIFEHYDFAQKAEPALSELVTGKLEKYGFELSWTDTVCDMINRVISAPLEHNGGSFTLSNIHGSDRLNELEFYFPLGAITPEKISGIFANHRILDIPSDFPELIQRLQFSPVKGFMKGFMDLVFIYDNKYYLVDWKSNHLGYTIEDYSPEKLFNVMKNNHYLLQYHIYTVALNKYLSFKQPGYDYKTHFGGVYYLFLRGIDPSTGKNYGIYYDLPSEELINELSDNLIIKPGLINNE